jgi:hypothetical protein
VLSKVDDEAEMTRTMRGESGSRGEGHRRTDELVIWVDSAEHAVQRGRGWMGRGGDEGWRWRVEGGDRKRRESKTRGGGKEGRDRGLR